MIPPHDNENPTAVQTCIPIDILEVVRCLKPDHVCNFAKAMEFMHHLRQLYLLDFIAIR